MNVSSNARRHRTAVKRQVNTGINVSTGSLFAVGLLLAAYYYFS